MRTLSRSCRFFLAQLKFGILPTEIEIYRYINIDNNLINYNRKSHPSERLIKLCKTRLCKDEVHFILIYPLYLNTIL